MQITIATWNIAGGRPTRSEGFFDYAPEDIGYFVEQLRILDADIICLQETHLNKIRSVAAEIAQKLECNFHETALSASHIDAEYSLGNAVIYKKEPKKIADLIFPYPSFPLILPDGRPDAHHDKGFQILEFDFGTIVNFQMMPLKFLGTPYDSESGMQFAKEMEQMLISNASQTALYCGDFNFHEPSMLYPKLLSGSRDVLPRVPTRPGGKKSDCIFVPLVFTVESSGVIETKTDHFLCWARIALL